MRQLRNFEDGEFSWVDLVTTDRVRAKDFYEAVFGWNGVDATSPGGTYTLLHHEGKEVGGLYEMSKAQRDHDTPPHWLLYVTVGKLDETMKRAIELGATIVNGPFDISPSARMGIIKDPGGAVLALWQGKKYGGADLVGHPVSMCWAELMTREAEPIVQFYTELFGWKADMVGDSNRLHNTFHRCGHPIGGVFLSEDEALRSQWQVYFRVSNLDRTIEEVNQNGGVVLGGPEEVSGRHAFATVADPQGAVFSVLHQSGAEDSNSYWGIPRRASSTRISSGSPDRPTSFF